MRAVILAGGRGSRLAPYTTVIPKPLLPVGDKPILEIIIRQLAAPGFDHITLSLGYMSVYFHTLPRPAPLAEPAGEDRLRRGGEADRAPPARWPRCPACAARSWS